MSETVSSVPNVTSLFLMVILSKAKPSKPESYDDPSGPTEPTRPLLNLNLISITWPAYGVRSIDSRSLGSSVSSAPSV